MRKWNWFFAYSFTTANGYHGNGDMVTVVSSDTLTGEILVSIKKDLTEQIQSKHPYLRDLSIVFTFFHILNEVKETQP